MIDATKPIETVGHPLPLAAMDGKVGVLGITGSGKTHTAIGLAEQLLSAGRQVIIIDPTGVYHGLRTAFPLPIFGGRHGDLPLGENDGDAIARVIIERNVSAIIDVSLLLKDSHASARRFMAGMVKALKGAPPAARYLVIDEADEFMPENATGNAAGLLGDLKWIVRRGRSEGWRVLMVTQRPQDIAKSVLTQCETLVLHQLTAPQDRKAVEEWVKGNADSGMAKEVFGTLAQLGTGEAWLWSPRHGILERATMPRNRSADTSATPDADTAPVALERLEAGDLEELRAALARPVDDVAAVASGSVRVDNGERAAMEAELRQLRAERDEWTVDRAYGQQQLDALIAENTAIREIAQRFTDAAADLARIRPALDEIPAQGGGGPSGDAGRTEGVRRSVATTSQASPPRATAPAPAARTATEKAGGGNASPAALAIADLLDRVNPARLTWTQAATMTGRKATGGNFNAARKWLRESGRIVEDGDFIRSSADASAGMTRAEAVDLWKSVLTNPAPKMIDALLVDDNGPVRGLSKDELGEAIGAAPRGGNFNNGLAQLRRNGVAVGHDGRFVLARPLPGETA